MLLNRYRHAIDAVSPEVLRDALSMLLAPHASPVFGAAKTIDHEVAAFNALKKLGYLAQDADEFDLVQKLRVTRTKARSLLYQAALRTERSDDQNTAALKRILCEHEIAVDGKYFVVEIPDPLLLEDVRRRVRRAKAISDKSFSGSIARLTDRALAHLLVDILDRDSSRERNSKLTRGTHYTPKTLQDAVVKLLAEAAKKAIGDRVASSLVVLGQEIPRLLQEGWGALRPYLGGEGVSNPD